MRIAPPSWLPNALSTGRFVLVGWWFAAAYGWWPYPESSPLGGFAALLAVAITDILDGTLARAFELTSKRGAVLDSTADKTVQILVLGALSLNPPESIHPVPLYFFLLLVLRDLTLIVGILWIWSKRRYVQAPHYWHGKVSTVVIFLLMLAAHLPVPRMSIEVAYALETALMLFSVSHYIREGVGLLRGAPPPTAGP